MSAAARTKPDSAFERMQSLFAAAKMRIENVWKLGVASGCNELNEPGQEHYPGLTNMEEYEDWTRDATTFADDKRVEKGQLVFCGSSMELKDIFSSVSTRGGAKKHCRHVMVIASAGMGKTTLLKKIAHDGFEGKYEMLENKLILMPELRAFKEQNAVMAPSQVFLDGVFPGNNQEDIDHGYEWMLDNPDKIVFIVDSLDTLSFNLEEDCLRITSYEAADLYVILHNLLSGNLFRDSKVISSSREHKVRNLHPIVRPDRCILLDGLKRDSVEQLIDEFVGEENGREIKRHINSECPDIWPLLSIPVLLVCSVISFLHGGFKPKTMSGILLKYLVDLVESPHSSSENMAEDLPKLMSFSFLGIKKGHVLFQPEELMSSGLKPQDVTDWGTAIVPAGQRPYILSKLMQSDRYFLYFNHQTIQECLAALHISSRNTETFCKCLKDFDEAKFSVVRRLVSGILLNPELRSSSAKKLVIIEDADLKKELLLEYLCGALRREQKCYKKDGLLELIIDLNEAKDGADAIIRSTFRKIDLSFIQLTESNVQVVASVASRCERLEEIALNNCSINAKKMEIFTNTLIKSNLKVNSLHLGVNDLGKTGMKLLAEVVKHCQVKILGIYGCSLEAERVRAFLDNAAGVKLIKLFASNNAVIGSEGMFYLGKLVQLCQPEEFGVRNCKLTGECIKRFAEGASNTKLMQLDISVNKELGSEGMSVLGNLVKNGLVRDIMAAGCNFNSDQLRTLIQSLGSSKIRSLDMNDYSNKPLYSKYILDLISCVENELDLRHWTIDETQQDDIMRKKIEIGAKVRILHHNKMRRDDGPHEPFKSGKNIIASDGGEIELGGCIAKFQPGALVHDGYIEFFLQSWGISKQPPKTVAISPMIICDFSHIGLMPDFEVEVEMRSYCFAQIPATASLMEMSPNSNEWVEEKEVILGRDRKLKFKTSATKFEKYFAFKRGTGNGWVVTFPVIPVLHCDKLGNFRSYLTLDDQLVAGKLNLSPGVDVLASAVDELAPLVIKFGDSVRTELQCIHPSGPSFGNDKRCQFTADELLKNIYLRQDFFLKNLPEKNVQDGVLKVQFSWEKNRPFPERNSSVCHVKWPPVSGLLSDIEPRPSISEAKLSSADERSSKTDHFEKRAQGVQSTKPDLSEMSVGAASAKDGRMQKDGGDVAKSDEEILSEYNQIVEKAYNKIARKKKEISSIGGHVELHGHRIRVPSGAVEGSTKIEIFTDNNPDHYPDNTTPISLIFGCKPSRFKVPVEVTVSTWFRPTGDRPVSVSLFVRSRSKPTWTFVRELNLTRAGEVTYNVSHFCEHVITKCKNPDGSYRFYSDAWIHNQSARIIPFLCLRDEKLLEKVREDLKPEHTRIISLLEETDIHLRSTVTMEMHWEDPDNLDMKIIGKNVITLNEKLRDKNKIHCYFKPVPDLSGLNRGLNELTYKVLVQKANEECLDEDAGFESLLSFIWPSPQTKDKDSERTINFNFGTVNAEKFVCYNEQKS